MLDKTMHKSTVSFCVGGGDTSHHGGITKQPRAHIQQWGGWLFSTMVLIAGPTLACVVIPYGSMVVMVGIMLVGVVNPCRS